MNTKAVVTNQFGAYTLELNQDGTVVVIRFDPAPPGRKFRGLGDLIEAGTRAVGIPTCRGCNERKEALNKAIPFGKAEEPKS
jgi:hypothetical protein